MYKNKNYQFLIYSLFLDLDELKKSLLMIKSTLKSAKDKELKEKKARYSSRISSFKIEMPDLPYSKSLNPNESSISGIKKEQSLIDDFSETKRKLNENDKKEEKLTPQKENSLLKHENIQMMEQMKTNEKKIGDLELEIENFKILNILKLKEKKMNDEEIFEPMMEDKINSIKEIEIGEKSSKKMNSIITKNFKGYFEDQKELLEGESKNNISFFQTPLQKNENIIKIWNFQENTLQLDMPHFTIVNNKKMDKNLLKKNGIITVEQKIFNKTLEVIIIEFYEFDGSESIL